MYYRQKALTTRLAVLILIAIVGVAALSTSNASVSTVDTEAESGTLAGNAVQVNDASASGGSAVSFQTSDMVPLPPVPADRIFTEDFESDSLSQWTNQSCPTGVTIVSDHARKGSKSAKFTTADDDTNAKCAAVPTENPRAQLVSKNHLFHDGDDYYIGFSTFFPADFPVIPTTGWLQIAEFYGPPFGGSPSMGVDVIGSKVCFSRDQSHNYDTIWCMSRDITRGTAWEDFVFHVKFSTDPSVGFVEVFHNGVAQTMKDGSQRTHYQTLLPGLNWDGTPNDLFLNQYRAAETSLGTVTLYHDEAYVGTTYESVAR